MEAETRIGDPGDGLMIGISRLRSARGEQPVSFDDIADHIRDFASISPNDRAAMDRFAAFLVLAEQVPHAHDDRAAGSSLEP